MTEIIDGVLFLEDDHGGRFKLKAEELNGGTIEVWDDIRDLLDSCGVSLVDITNNEIDYEDKI